MKNIFISLLSLIVITSCKKEGEVNLDEFQVTMTKAPVIAGDTAFFEIQGNPDVISFYSGERGRNYDNRNRLTSESSIPVLNFTSFAQNLSAQHPNSLALLISSDYKGDTTAINTANWTDITSRAVLSTGVTGTVSGNINLTDFRQFDSVSIAFRYRANNSATAIQPTWTIQSFNITNTSLPDSVVHSLRTIAIAGWQVADISNPDIRWAPAATQLKITGGLVNSNNNDDWAVSKVSLKSVNPDLGVPIKNISERLNKYFYRFTKAGTYKVTFLAAGKRYNSEGNVIKQFDITVN
jgi:Domain of unknown function (DUF5017)